jgi:hypothetical protein
MDSDINHESMARVMERLTRAGWASNTIASPKGIQAAWTPLGRQRISELARIMMELGWPNLLAADLQVLCDLLAALRLMPPES